MLDDSLPADQLLKDPLKIFWILVYTVLIVALIAIILAIMLTIVGFLDRISLSGRNDRKDHFLIKIKSIISIKIRAVIKKITASTDSLIFEKALPIICAILLMFTVNSLNRITSDIPLKPNPIVNNEILEIQEEHLAMGEDIKGIHTEINNLKDLFQQEAFLTSSYNAKRQIESFYCNFLIEELKKYRTVETGRIHARSSSNPMTYGHNDIAEYFDVTPGWDVDTKALRELPVGPYYDYDYGSDRGITSPSGEVVVKMFPERDWSRREDNRGMGTRFIGFSDITTRGFRVNAHLSTKRSSPNPFAGKENASLSLRVTYPEILPASTDKTAIADFKERTAYVVIPEISPERSLTLQNVVVRYTDGSEKQISADGDEDFDVEYDETTKQVTVTKKH